MKKVRIHKQKERKGSMKNNRFIKFISILLVMSFAFFTCTSVSVFGEEGEGEIQHPVYDDDYDVIYVSGSNSHANRYYSTAWWFWDGAEAETRLTCSSSHPTYDQEYYVYASIENTNKANDIQTVFRGGIPGTNLYEVAETPNLESKKATNITHTAFLKINGIREWSASLDTYQLP